MQYWGMTLSGHVRCSFFFSRFSVVSISSFSLAIPLLCVSFLRLLSPVLIFPELQATFLSHWATYGATATNTSSSFTDHPSPAVCPYLLYRSRARFHRWFPTLSRNWSPGYVTKTKSAALNRSFLLSRSSPGHFSVLLWRVALSRPYAGVSAD